MNNLNRININKTEYIRSSAVPFKGQYVETNPMVFPSYDKETENQEDLKTNSPADKVNFLGFISNAFGKLLDKAYENSTPDLVLADIENSDVKSSLDLVA